VSVCGWVRETPPRYAHHLDLGDAFYHRGLDSEKRGGRLQELMVERRLNGCGHSHGVCAGWSIAGVSR
jgi:hypothetical protein